MYLLYSILNNESGSMYIGMTSKTISQRWSGHKHAAISGKKSKLYDAMRSYGIAAFSIAEMDSYETKEDCCKAEIDAIKLHRSIGENLYNLADGGEGGYVIPDHLKDEWKAKLSIARQGRKPALGMKHTDETKKLCGEYGKKRWDIYGRYSIEVTQLSFKEAKEKFNISKTHYYRLLKRTKSNGLS